MQNKIIWLTGGSGSGKSTAAEIFRDMGLNVIDADEVSRKISEKGKPAYLEIVESFGTDILNSDGSIDRRKLGGIVFNDKKKLGILNEVTHKYIKQELLRLACSEVAVIDAALPPDGFLVPLYIIAVTANEEKRIERITSRDKVSEEYARNRISSQMTEADYEKIADAVFQNNGSVTELKNKIEAWCKNEKII